MTDQKFTRGQEGSKNIRHGAQQRLGGSTDCGGSAGVKRWLALGKEVSWKGRRLRSVSELCETEIREGLWVIKTIIIITVEGELLEEGS